MEQESALLIANASLITGDGHSFAERGFVRIRRGQIVQVGEQDPDMAGGEQIIDAKGCTIVPGIINAHAHGCVAGPSMPSGSAPIATTDIEYFRNRHLLCGTTTLLNVCGLALPDEIEADDGKPHALDVHVTTAHSASNLAAAMIVDGKGLSERHRQATIDAMIERGAKALGEAGGGQTLGGGAQDYRFLPAAIEAATGLRMMPGDTRALKEAVLGRHLNGHDALDDAGLATLMRKLAIDGHISLKALRELVTQTVMPPVAVSLKGLEEIAAHSARLRLPAIFHNAAPTADLLVRLAEIYPQARIVAGHSNHPMFTPEEAIDTAIRLRERGATIDVSTLDCISTRWRNNPENLDALVEGGLVDTLSTDFAGGDWDSILSAIHRMIRKKQLSAPKAVALATGNVARVFPELAGDRGLIACGKRADLTICDSHNLSRVRHVLIAGKFAVYNGAIV